MSVILSGLIGCCRLPRIDPRCGFGTGPGIAVALALALVVATPANAGLRPEASSSAPTGQDADVFVEHLRETDKNALPRLAAAAANLPALLAKMAEVDQADAQSLSAASPRLPRITLEAIGNQSLDRNLGGNSTFAERLMPRGRADASIAVDQLLFDFGATLARARAGAAGADAARADLALAREQAALLLCRAWNGLVAARLEAETSASHTRRIALLAAEARQRFDRGIDGGPALAVVNAYAAEAAFAQTMARRRLAGAEALFVSLFGEAPAAIRWPLLPAIAVTIDDTGPRVAAAQAQLRAAGFAADAAGRERLPQISTRMTGALYNVLGSGMPDYDVRGQLVIRQGFSLGGAELARKREADARKRVAEQELARALTDDRRERSTAISDVILLADAQGEAMRRYDHSRRGLEMVTIQARMLRAAPGDVLRSEQGLQGAMLSLIRLREDELNARAQRLASAGRLAEALNMDKIE